MEIAKALSHEARILVMDEPTATLTPQEVEKLFALIRDLKSQGLGIIYISHRLDEIDALADRVMVLRDGELVGVKPRNELARDDLIEMMVGRRLDQEFPPRSTSLERADGVNRASSSSTCRAATRCATSRSRCITARSSR